MDKRGRGFVFGIILLFLLVGFSSYLVFASTGNTKSYDSATSTVTITSGTNDNLQCNANLTDDQKTNLTAYWTWYKNDIFFSSGLTQVQNGIDSLIATLLADNTTKGDHWICEVKPSDGYYNGTTLNSSSVTILTSIVFNVTDSYYGTSLNNVLINCNSTNFSQAEDTTNTYGPYGFYPGSYYTCEFAKTNFYNKTETFNSNEDKTIIVGLSEKNQLTVEEHTWLEAIYNCLYSGDCSLYNLLLEVNQTIGKIWENIKPTDESVITFENITNKLVDSTHNLTIDYTINIPIKAGYSSGTYLPIRIGFWFMNETNTACYNQGDKPIGVEEPYCQPLIIETLGPMGGTVNFTVKLHPELPAGNYSIKRIIDIDPNNVWINYGQETIGSFVMKESLSTYGITVEKTGESNPSVNTNNQQQSSSSSEEDSSSSSKKITNIYNTYNTISNQESQTPLEEGVIKLNNPTRITGGIIRNLAPSGEIIITIISLALVLIIFIISRKRLC